MSSALDVIRQVQQLDEKIDGLEAEVARLPKHVAEIERRLEVQKAELAAQKQALAENEKERRRLEGEASVWEQKAAKLQEQIVQAKTNEQYRAFRNEIAFAKKEQKKAEDSVLDKMEEAEALEEKIAAAGKALADEAESVAAEVERAKEQVRGDERQLAAVREEREKLGATVRPELLAAYQRVRKKLGRKAVSPMVSERCTSCNMLLRPQITQKLRAGADGVITCDFCGCILYWEDPNAVKTDDPAGEAGIH